MVCITLNCVGLTQFSVIRIIHRNVGLKCFCIYLNVCYYRYYYLRQGGNVFAGFCLFVCLSVC